MPEAEDVFVARPHKLRVLVVIAAGGMFKTKYQYLTSYRGLAFFTKSPTALVLPGRADVITAKSMSIPDV